MIQLSATDKTFNINLLKQEATSYYAPEQTILRDMTITQGILEGALNRIPPSSLAYKYNNLFGIKGIGTGGSVELPTHEFYDGEMHEVDQSFAVNTSIKESIAQHDRLLHLSRYTRVLQSTSFEQAAQAIHDCGYATDPNYSLLLINTYNEYVK